MRLDKAVVIGGSIAGLLAARVLSDYFQEVIIIEKDKYENDKSIRKGPLRQTIFTFYLSKEKRYF